MMERKDWKVVKLGDVCDIISGSTPKTKEPTFWEGKHFWITPAELKGDKWVSSTERTLTDEGVKNAHLQILPVGTVLLSSRAPIGKIAITTVPMYCNQGFKNLVCSDLLKNEYLYWYLLYKEEYIKSLGVGATFKEISKTIVASIPIPVPPLPVQARIVDELDCLQGILSKKRQQLAEYHSLAQAIFHQMFGDPVVNEKGWEVKKWKELFDTKLGKMLDRSQHTSSQKQYPYLANTNVQWGYFDLSDLRTMPFSDEELIKYDLEENDLLICEGGESGRCAIWHNKYSNQNILFQKAIHRARIKKANTVDITYISYFIRYSKELGGLKDYISKSTIEHLTGEKLKSLPIPLPPLPLQQSFAARIAAIDSQRERLAASIRELETLFACRMETLLNCPQA